MIIFIGLIIIAIGVFIEWDTLRFLPGTVSTMGIISYCYKTGNSLYRETYCYPTVSFQTLAGQEVTFESGVGSSEYYEGKTVTVKYHPNNPQDARLDPGLAWLFCISVGSLFVLSDLFSCLRGLISKIRGKVS